MSRFEPTRRIVFPRTARASAKVPAPRVHLAVDDHEVGGPAGPALLRAGQELEEGHGGDECG